MKGDLDPLRVAARLARLRELYVPESLEEVRRRLAQDRPAEDAEPFSRAVERRLAELSALDELARHLHRGR